MVAVYGGLSAEPTSAKLEKSPLDVGVTNRSVESDGLAALLNTACSEGDISELHPRRKVIGSDLS
jgi:hypothetical protein